MGLFGKKKIELFNTAPNGVKIDRVFLTKVSNIDNSGYEYFIEYKDDFVGKEYIPIGRCELVNGHILFDNVGESAQTLGIGHKAMKLLVEWIENNLEDIDDL